MESGETPSASNADDHSTVQKQGFISKYSENLAGAISLAGSTVVLANSLDVEWNNLITAPMASVSYNGDPTYLIAAGAFTFAEITFVKAGNKTWGYSLGALGFAAGDLVLVFSGTAQDQPWLQASLIAMTAAWGLAAMRYPIEEAAKRLKGKAAENFQKAADIIPKIAGTSNLVLRVPGVVTALNTGTAGGYVLAGAIAAWGTADVLAGRLQETVKEIYQSIKGTKKDPEVNNTPGPS